jgi:hypothetical protein
MSVKQYTQAIHQKFGYLANWLPNTPLKLGDIVVRTPTGFRHVETLRNLRISYRTRRSKKALLEHTAHSTIKARVGLGGSGAGLSLGFGENGGFVFQAKGCEVQTIEDFDDVRIEMLDLFYEQIWKRDWILVDTIVKAARTNILVSEGANASLDIDGPADMAQMLTANLGVIAQSGSLTKFLAEADLVPLFQARRVTKRWWGLLPPKVIMHRGPDDDLTPPEFETLDVSDWVG